MQRFFCYSIVSQPGCVCQFELPESITLSIAILSCNFALRVLSVAFIFSSCFCFSDLPSITPSPPPLPQSSFLPPPPRHHHRHPLVSIFQTHTSHTHTPQHPLLPLYEERRTTSPLSQTGVSGTCRTHKHGNISLSPFHKHKPTHTRKTLHTRSLSLSLVHILCL